ncbi:MAG TPA: SIS domain-containing protein [Syntrophales bacterium]|nr:SIS domain-containing protein [Syntrophales bacterium]
MQLNYIKKIANSLKTYKLYLGLAPQPVRGPAIILFPLCNCLLCCGLAGIVTVKKAPPPPDIDPVLQLAELLEKIGKNDLQTILSGSLATEFYLNGGGYLEEMECYVRSLKTDENFQRLFFNSGNIRRLSDLVGQMKDFLSQEERLIDENASSFSTGKMETINGRLVSLRDIVWAAGQDILRNVEKIVKLSGAVDICDIPAASLKKYKKINFLLNCLDRLEVRGRDSAGVHITFTLDASTGNRIPDVLSLKGLRDEFFKRGREGDLINGSISLSTLPHMEGVTSDGVFLSFTYKTSSIVGELGLNTANLIKSIREDRIFHELSKLDTISDAVCVHTRWASVGSITEENCHPVNNFTTCGDSSDGAGKCSRNYPFYGKGPWTISVALNGDIDNYQSLRNGLEQGEELIAPEVTTDTKIIPLIIENYLTRGDDLRTAFRRAVNDFEGSHAIAMVSNVEPDKVFLALRGSGQSLYVGIAPDQYIFSSELYGIVEVTPFFLKMAGEGIPEAPSPESAGQICVLDQNSPGGLEGISAFSYDGTLLKLKEEQIRKAEITTRDIDRGNYPHYFLKEITESTLSVKKTLRGKYRINRKEAKKSVLFNLGEDVLPLEVKTALAEGSIARIMVIGHGTAAVAGEAIACAMNRYLEGSPIKCEAKIASELSGFCLSDNLRDTLIIAITQSGTTTDTNRAVAMAVERGARVVAIVNRRQSDICTKAQGVFYTGNGRDIEMSVASTKAFYSQIVAGHILALYLAQLLKIRSDDFIAEELGALEQAPALMTRVLEKKEQVRLCVEKTAGQKRHWAVVGSGPNKTAADEIRIKLSELCYRTISSDVVENKKHIDLSAEPLIIVCSAGNPETVLGDIIKDVAIFKAHKACVIVIADEGEERFHEIADAVIDVPRAPMPLSVILNTLAGHLWGYFAACYIDEESLFFREFRNRLNMAMAEQVRKNYSLYEKIADREFRWMVREFYADFNRRRRNGAFSLTNVKTSSDMVLLLKYASGALPLDDFWHEFPGEGGGGFASPLELLDITVGMAIDELSRPIDAIRHQAKTVTVGTSRKEPPLHGVVFDLLNELGFSYKAVTTKNILSLTALQPAIGEIRGYTLYDTDELDNEGNPTDLSTLSVSKRGGISLSLKSRVEASGALMGTKRTIVSTGHIYVGYGKSDRAPIVIIPLLEDKAVRNLLLIHVVFNESLTLSEKKDVLGYRYNDIRNLINEYNLPWNDRHLENIPLALLLGEPVEVIAERIRQDRPGIETEVKQ